ncbi:MAG: HipA domain-containing protein [Oscillospiraceae bacterium]|nr:HipA domain-containing protein [Oscillospiraceae bacterium]
MNYILMHRKTAVAQIVLRGKNAKISNIGEVFDFSRLPVGITVKDERPDLDDLDEWWSGRSIPASRHNFSEAMGALGISSSKELIAKCFGLSLSDQYWINPIESPLEWEKINFFDNPFSEDVGNALFGKTKPNKKLNLISPDNTSDGLLKKKWKIIDGKRCLIKGGSDPFQQEPFNEAAACAIMKRLKIPHVSYSVIWEENFPHSVCEDFITSETELVSAFSIHNIKKIENADLLYEHYLACCEELGIPDARFNLDKMLVLDYIIANNDRHLSNFGAVRNAQTLKWISTAPIFDSGTSLWHNQLPMNIKAETAASKPFCNTHEEQIKLVKDFSWLEAADLMNIDEELDEIFRGSPFIDVQRRDALCFGLKKRVEMLCKHMSLGK